MSITQTKLYASNLENTREPQNTLQSQPSNSMKNNAPSAAQEVVSYYKNFFPNLWFGAVNMPNTENFLVLLFGTIATTITIFRADDGTANYINKHPSFMGKWANLGNNEYVAALLGVTIGLGNIGYGLGTNRLYDIYAGEAQLESAAATAIYTTILKYSVGRERPFSNSKTSFPSGHTSMTFAAAQSTTDMYGWWGLPVYLYAAYTGISRISVNAHHISDVLFGATLGIIVAHGYSVYHKKRYEQLRSSFPQKAQYITKKIQIYPYYETNKNFGLEVVTNF